MRYRNMSIFVHIGTYLKDMFRVNLRCFEKMFQTCEQFSYEICFNKCIYAGIFPLCPVVVVSFSCLPMFLVIHIHISLCWYQSLISFFSLWLNRRGESILCIFRLGSTRSPCLCSPPKPLVSENLKNMIKNTKMYFYEI